MKNKRGQYYLIAAMIIIVILASFISVINFASKNSNDPMKEIEKELNNEIEEILNYYKLRFGKIETIICEISYYIVCTMLWRIKACFFLI